MKSFFFAAMVCSLFCLATIATVNGATSLGPGCDNCGGGCGCGCGCDCGNGCGCGCGSGCGCNNSCGCGYNWWSLKGCACHNDCEDCGYPCCGPRAGGCDRCNCCRPMTCHDKTYCEPLTPLFAIFTHDSWSNCGCGQRYWGDFYGDPPDFCDPCDRCGNYTGRWNGWGGCNGCGSACRGCGNCCGGQPMMEQTSSAPPLQEGKVINQGDRVSSRQIPTPAAKTRKIVNQ